MTSELWFIPSLALGALLLFRGALRIWRLGDRSTEIPLSVHEIRIRESLRVRLNDCNDVTDQARARLLKNIGWLEGRSRT